MEAYRWGIPFRSRNVSKFDQINFHLETSHDKGGGWPMGITALLHYPVRGLPLSPESGPNVRLFSSYIAFTNFTWSSSATRARPNAS